MKYSVENIRNIDHSIAIGPLTTSKQRYAVIEKMIVLETRPSCTLRMWKTHLAEGTIFYLSYRYYSDTLGYSSDNPGYKEVISYQTFMEHNTEKIYRIKTWEELSLTEDVKVVEGTVCGKYNTFTKNMIPFCGSSISEEQYYRILADTENGIRLAELGAYCYTAWMVTDKPLNMKEREVISYKLKKEYPGRSIGDIVKYNSEFNNTNFYWEEDNFPIPTEFQPDLNPQWFEPIYKEIKSSIQVMVGNPLTAVIIHHNGTYSVGRFVIDISHLRELKSLFLERSLIHTSLPYSYKLDRIWVGCDQGCFINMEDIDKILNTYTEEYENN